MSKLLLDENEDDETTFYKGAFQSFDWNHSGRIATSVSSHLVKIWLHTKNQLLILPGSAPKVCVGGGGVEGNFSVTLWSKP